MLAGGHRGIGANARRSLSLVRNGFNKTEVPNISIQDPSTTIGSNTGNNNMRSLIMTPPAKGQQPNMMIFGSNEKFSKGQLSGDKT